MTLNKAVKELLDELNNPNLTEEEKKALNKYQRWLFSIKTTVTNNKEPSEHFKDNLPIEKRRRISQALDTLECGYNGGDVGCGLCGYKCGGKQHSSCMGMDEAMDILSEFIYEVAYIDEEEV